jgi:hypothetical protein
VQARRAYILLNEGDQLVARHDIAGALAAYDEATRIIPPGVAHGEAELWTGITLAGDGRLDDAEPFLRRAAEHAGDDRWARLVPRLVSPGILPSDPALIARLVELATPQ